MTDKPRLTTADLVVLSVFLYAGPMHGYEVAKKLQESDVEDWAPISRPQIYYSLRKLARDGYLAEADNTARPQGPERIVYKPAAKAKAAMRETLGAPKWSEQRPPSPFVTWTALALHADAATIEAQIDRRAAFLQQEINREKDTLAALETTSGANEKVACVMVKMAVKQFEAEASLLQELRETLINAAKSE